MDISSACPPRHLPDPRSCKRQYFFKRSIVERLSSHRRSFPYTQPYIDSQVDRVVVFTLFTVTTLPFDSHSVSAALFYSIRYICRDSLVSWIDRDMYSAVLPL